MLESKLFLKEADDVEGEDSLVWVGEFNGTTIEIYERSDTGAEEIYAGVGDDGSLEKAAADLAAFLDSAQPEDYQAQVSTEDPNIMLITIGGHPYSAFAIEGEGEDRVVVGDLQIDDDEMDYLQVNGVLPDPKFGDEDLDLGDTAGDEDFWDGE
uniref:Uncharacterized protein n=1 Tax=Serratia phage Kevin TaxID=3161161 RepID=A0AAU8L0I0_9CAUD